MLFLDPKFWLVFVPAFVLALAIRWPLARMACVLAASVAFQLAFFPGNTYRIVWLLTGLTFACALFSGDGKRKGWIRAGIVLNVLVLIFYKYLDFLGGTLADGARLAGIGPGSEWKPLAIVAPLGISFFVFEFVHYLVEVGNGTRACRNPLHFAIYSAFFPTVVCGPIKRFPDFERQLKSSPAPTWEDACVGATRAIIGFAKKAVIASPAYHFVVTLNFEGRTTWVWLMTALAAQIYFDFSGYSDMAIGLSRMLGYRVPENFQNPYLARNIAEFWRRWHMSLSSWIRDYLFTPMAMGLKRRGSRMAGVVAIVVAMFLCGLWHGPQLHFGAFGLWHGFLLAVNVPVERGIGKLGVLGKKRGIGWQTAHQAAVQSYRVATLLAIGFGWVLFFYDWKTFQRISPKLTAFW